MDSILSQIYEMYCYMEQDKGRERAEEEPSFVNAAELEDQLEMQLDDELKGKLRQYDQLMFNAMEEVGKKRFLDGFCFGVRMMRELMDR